MSVPGLGDGLLVELVSQGARGLCPVRLGELAVSGKRGNAQVGAHRYDGIRENLWPWLRERQDDRQLDAFLGRLGRRDVHLRPGIEVRRIWPWAPAVDLDERGALVGEVRAAVTELLTALDEPLPPAHP
jgi:hypothetical protein